ncbi:S-methyl-5-thioribose kinase [Sulfurimonas sp.]|nr:S-methyl-5-thioribose kinase [Sulfurimonas sp.]
MDYKVLDKNSVIEYLLEIKEIKNFFESEEIEAKEIGDGNLNFVYLVSLIDNPEKSMIVKQAVPYLRCVGEEFPLSRERMTYEIRALDKFYSIFPNFVPRVYYSSEEMSLVAMEYLSNHIIMREGLINRVKYENFSEHISTYMAATLFYTSSLSLSSVDKRDLMAKFNQNVELCKLTEDLVFSFAFMEHETNDNANVESNENAQKLFADRKFKAKVLGLKYTFMTQSDALLHGDLHTGSIMINSDETYVIDPEFAFVGPFGFDVGALLANLVNNYIHHSIVTKDEEFQKWLLHVIKDTLEKFSEKFLEFWAESKETALLVDGYLDSETLDTYKNNFVKNILKDSVGFAGCKIARRIYGVAGVEEIRGINDITLRREAEAMALRIAREFVMNYERIENTDEILEIIKSAR